MMKKRLKGFYSLIYILLITIIVGCTITPEMEEREDLSLDLKELSTPSNITISNNHQDKEITISWDSVPNANFYTIEYQKATSYLSNQPMKSFVTSETSFTIPDDSNSNDKRYVFRIKAGKSSDSRSILESSYSELCEGVIVDYFSVSPIIQGKKLSLYANYSRVNSVLGNGTLVQPTVKYYKQEFLPDSILNGLVTGDELKKLELESNHTFNWTAALYVEDNGIEIELMRIPVNFKTDIDYIPSSVINPKGTKNEKDKISLSWTAPEIGSGLGDSVELLFNIQRKEGDGEWEYLKDSNGELLEIPNTSEGQCSYTDTSVESNKDYFYKVISIYKFAINDKAEAVEENSKEYAIYSQDVSKVEPFGPCYIVDTLPKSFTIKQGETIKKEDGSASYPVTIEWETFHALPAEVTLNIIRREYSLADSAGNVKANENTDLDKVITIENNQQRSVEDEINLDVEQNKKKHEFSYTIEYKYDDSLLGSATVNDSSGKISLVVTEPTVTPKDFIESFSVTSGESSLATIVKLNWSLQIKDVDTIEENPENGNLTTDNIDIHIYRADKGTTDFKEIGKVTEANVTTFTDEEVEQGKSYDYRLVAEYVDAENSTYNGQESESEVVTGSVLAKPSNFKATINEYNDKIELSWDPVENASGYVISYRLKGTENTLEKEDVTDGNTSTKSFGISDKIKSSSYYEFFIQAKDINDGLTPISETFDIYGAILGQVQNLKVTSGSDYITVSWEPVENITSYDIKVYSENDIQSVPKLEKTIRDLSETSFTLTVEDVTSWGMEGYSLSQPYYFIVLPAYNNVKSTIKELTPGNWLMPPKNITATKADYIDLIEISWEKPQIDDFDGYRLYFRKANEEFSEYNYFEVAKDTTTYLDTRHTDDQYFYTLATYSMSKGVGPIQNYFEKEEESFKNLGYVLLKPRNVIGEDLNNGEFVFSFYESPGATAYFLEIEGDSEEIIISANDIPTEVNTSKEVQGGRIVKGSDGRVSFYTPRRDLTTSVRKKVGISAHNENGKLDLRNTTTEVDASFEYKSLRDYEYVNLANLALSQVYKYADAYYEGDWWEFTTTKPISPFNGVTVERPYGAASWGEDLNLVFVNWKWSANGTTLNGYSFTDSNYYEYLFDTEESIINRTNKDTYNVETPLGCLIGTVNVSFPLKYGQQVKIKYTNFNVRDPKSTTVNIGGDTWNSSVSVSIDGGPETTIDLSKLTNSIL